MVLTQYTAGVPCSRMIRMMMVMIMVMMAMIVPAYTASPWDKLNDYSAIAKPRDCEELWDAGIRNPGVYKIFLDHNRSTRVYCAHTATGTGTLIQRRVRGDDSFYRGWQDYKNGFGNLASDFWAGLDTIHHLTYTGQLKLEIMIQDWTTYNVYNMTYDYIVVGDENVGYRLQLGRAYGLLLDDMSHSNNSRFATFDHPDLYNCAVHQKAGWWYNYCAFTLLNGVYHYGGKYTPTGGYYDGIYWKDWHGYDYSLKLVTMTLVKRF